MSIFYPHLLAASAYSSLQKLSLPALTILSLLHMLHLLPHLSETLSGDLSSTKVFLTLHLVLKGAVEVHNGGGGVQGSCLYLTGGNIKDVTDAGGKGVRV